MVQATNNRPTAPAPLASQGNGRRPSAGPSVELNSAVLPMPRPDAQRADSPVRSAGGDRHAGKGDAGRNTNGTRPANESAQVPYTREEIMLAGMQARDRLLAESFTLWIGLAAESHPEEVRKALAKVFDLQAVRVATVKQMEILKAVWKSTKDAKDTLHRIEIEIAGLRDELDAVRVKKP